MDLAAIGTRGIMLRTGAALVPAFAAATCWFGPGVLVNLAVALGAGVALEAGWVWARFRTFDAVKDASTPVTCALIAIAVPPALHPGILVFAAAMAVILAKQLYGGIGKNVFNPAMVGYAAALVAFPAHFADWDVLTGATALDAFRFREGATVAEVWRPPAFGLVGAHGFEVVNAAALAGGLYLCAVRIANWRMPVAVLAALGACAALGYDNGSSASLGSPMFHWFSGGTMLAAFFIATDPVTSPSSVGAQWIFGISIGVLIYCIRSFGAYPDGIAFAVLLANLAAPALDKAMLRT
ncbi:MAG: RnfABCDGE type electron transport complex subunit D [Gammaproteobacteria bacterium]|nr:RnfABCDGE type electron transport complex subunit D [Gammaproteobacteria bacterium]